MNHVRCAPIWLRVTASIVIKHLINIPCNYRFRKSFWNKMEEANEKRIECRIIVFSGCMSRVSSVDVVSTEAHRHHQLPERTSSLSLLRRFGVCWGFGFFSDEQFSFFGCWVVESGCGVHHATTYRMHPMCHFGIQFNYNFLFKYIREWNVKLHKLYVFRLEIKLNWRKTRGEVSRCAVEIQVELGRSVGVCETRHTHANSWTEADIFHTRQMTSRRAEEKTQFTQIHVINERR